MLLYMSNNILLCLIFIFDYYILFYIVIYIMPCFLILVVSKIHVLFGLNMNEDDVCLADCETTRTILWDKKYFLKLTLIKVNVSTISGTTNLVEGFGRGNIMLTNGTRFHINNALYSRKSRRNFFSFKYIYAEMYIILKLWMKIM